MKRAPHHIVVSDDHPFVGRVFDLAMPVHLGFQSYEQITEYPDCFYVFHVHRRVELLTSRIESLNVIGTMLWTRKLPRSFKDFPISRYQWLNVIADVFLMRLISTKDCSMLLASEVLECGIDPRRCNMDTLQKSGVSADVLDALRALSNAYVELRQERNFRFHHGFERSFSDDDSTFRTASLFEHRGRGIVGEDQHGRQIDVDRYFKDGLKGLRADFTAAARSLYVQINALYDLLYDEFEPRFSKKFRARTRQLPW